MTRPPVLREKESEADMTTLRVWSRGGLHARETKAQRARSASEKQAAHAAAHASLSLHHREEALGTLYGGSPVLLPGGLLPF